MVPPPRTLSRAGWSVISSPSLRSTPEPKASLNLGRSDLEADGARLVADIASCWSDRYIHTIRRHGSKAGAFHYEVLFSQPAKSLPVPGVVISVRFALVTPKELKGLTQEPRLFYSFEDDDLRNEWALKRDIHGLLQIVRGQQVISMRDGCFERFLDSVVVEKDKIRRGGTNLVTGYESTRLPPPAAYEEVFGGESLEKESEYDSFGEDAGLEAVGSSIETLDSAPTPVAAGKGGNEETVVAIREAMRAAGLACDKVRAPNTLSELLVNIFDAADEDSHGAMQHYDVARLLGAILPGFGLEEWDIHLLLTTAPEDDDGFIECLPFIQSAPEVIQDLRKRRMDYRAREGHVDVPQEAVRHCFGEEVGATVDMLWAIFEQCAHEDPNRGLFYFTQQTQPPRRSGTKMPGGGEGRRGSNEMAALYSPTPTGAEGEEQVLVALKRRFCRECLLQVAERLSPQEISRLMQMLQEDENGFVYIDDLTDRFETLRTDALLNALVETDVATLRKQLILNCRQMGLQEDGKLKLWVVKQVLLQMDQICLSRLQIHALLCLASTDAQGNVEIREFLAMCCAVVPHMCDARVFKETAEKLQADDAEATRRKENAELAALQASKVGSLGQEVEEKVQEIEVDQETVERTLQQVLTLVDDARTSTLTPEKIAEVLLGGTDVQVQSCQLSDFELCGFVAEMSVDARGEVAYVDHVKRWVPVIFEVRKSLLLGAYLKDGSAEQLGIKEPDMRPFERDFPLFEYSGDAVVVRRRMVARRHSTGSKRSCDDDSDSSDGTMMMGKTQTTNSVGGRKLTRSNTSKERTPSKDSLGRRSSSKEAGGLMIRSQTERRMPSKRPSIESFGGDRILTVTIISARGLRNADFSKTDRVNFSDPYCVCEIIGKPRSKIRTAVIDDSLSPVWNYEAVVPSFERGDSLTFTIADKDMGKKDDVLGRATITGAQIQFGGLEGEIPLQDAGEGIKAFLTVKLVVDPPFNEQNETSADKTEQAKRERLLCPTFKYLGEPTKAMPKGRGYERRKLMLQHEEQRKEAERLAAIQALAKE